MPIDEETVSALGNPEPFAERAIADQIDASNQAAIAALEPLGQVDPPLVSANNPLRAADLVTLEELDSRILPSDTVEEAIAPSAFAVASLSANHSEKVRPSKRLYNTVLIRVDPLLPS
jgi:hypothetical protein